jgi:hypothetical protein
MKVKLYAHMKPRVDDKAVICAGEVVEMSENVEESRRPGLIIGAMEMPSGKTLGGVLVTWIDGCFMISPLARPEGTPSTRVTTNDEVACWCWSCEEFHHDSEMVKTDE